MRGVVDEFADAAIGAGGAAVYDCDAGDTCVTTPARTKVPARWRNG